MKERLGIILENKSSNLLFLKWITKPKSRVKKQRRLSWIALSNKRTKENTEGKRWIKRRANMQKSKNKQLRTWKKHVP